MLMVCMLYAVYHYEPFCSFEGVFDVFFHYFGIKSACHFNWDASNVDSQLLLTQQQLLILALKLLFARLELRRQLLRLIQGRLQVLFVALKTWKREKG